MVGLGRGRVWRQDGAGRQSGRRALGMPGGIYFADLHRVCSARGIHVDVPHSGVLLERAHCLFIFWFSPIQPFLYRGTRSDSKPRSACSTQRLGRVVWAGFGCVGTNGSGSDFPCPGARHSGLASPRIWRAVLVFDAHGPSRQCALSIGRYGRRTLV